MLTASQNTEATGSTVSTVAATGAADANTVEETKK